MLVPRPSTAPALRPTRRSARPHASHTQRHTALHPLRAACSGQLDRLPSISSGSEDLANATCCGLFSGSGGYTHEAAWKQG